MIHYGSLIAALIWYEVIKTNVALIPVKQGVRSWQARAAFFMSGSGETEALLQVVSKYSKQISEDFGFRKFLSLSQGLLTELKRSSSLCHSVRYYGWSKNAPTFPDDLPC